MQSFWIPARKAVELLEPEGGHAVRYALCKRAHAGLLNARAKLLIIDQSRAENTFVPSYFWWAEGESALDQDWVAGDFTTWIESRVQMRAFGVEFDFEGLRELLPPERGPLALRELSVCSDPAWASAREARRFMYEKLGVPPISAGSQLIDQCRLGFVPVRAQLMQRKTYGNSDRWSVEEREWDVADWFWTNFTRSGSSSQDWDLGMFKGSGYSHATGGCHVQLTGVYFLRAALDALVPGSTSPSPSSQDQNKGGRPRKDWWDDLWCAVWGQVYRGELTPKNQSEIAQAMLAWVEGQGETVSESTVKPLARKMFAEMQR